MWKLSSLVICVCIFNHYQSTAANGICAIFRSDRWETTLENDGNYINIGRMDVDINFHIEMKIHPAARDHDGTLFAISNNPTFNYYEWKTAAVNIQYLVVEIIYSAVSLTIKDLGAPHLTTHSLFNIGSEGYELGDLHWHTVKAWRTRDYWFLSIDDKEKRFEVSRSANMSTDIHVADGYASIGGRQGYFLLQYRGMIKDVRINHRQVTLVNKEIHREPPTPNSLQITACNSQLARQFRREMRQEMHQMQESIDSYPSWEEGVEQNDRRPSSGLPESSLPAGQPNPYQNPIYT